MSVKVSIITSMYKGGSHIDGFLKNMISQTYFDKCELIIVDGNSPENERETIDKYMNQHDNIIYHRLEEDPGIYGCWNKGIEVSSGEYITNANLDDKRAHEQIEIFVKEMDSNPDIDLVYSYCFVTNKDHEDFYNNSSNNRVYPIKPFSPQNMIKCLPGCMPVWRRSMHDDIGLFDESYKYAGDWEMWLRAVRNGSKFKMVDMACGVYYVNPEGLSTSPSNETIRFSEEEKVFWEYNDVFGEDVSKQYGGYFSR